MAASHPLNQWNPDEASLPSVSERVDILIVDDLPEKQLIYQTILEDLGQNLYTARSGEEALKLVLQREFAVILLDVDMPGMNGFETAAMIRHRRKSAKTPIIFLTGFTDEFYVAQGYATGAVDYLQTPIVPEVLKAKVRVFIELSQMRRQAALQAEEQAKRRAAEELAQRSAFLARFSELLARSQNQTEITHTLAQLPIPVLADVSVVWLADDREGPGRMEWNWKGRETGREPPPFPVPVWPWLEQAIQPVLASGRMQHYDRLCVQPADDPVATSTPALGSTLLFPLLIRGEVQGVLLLARKRTEPAFQADDFSLASDLASRASVALENAILIEKIRDADWRKDEFLGMLAHELRNPLGPIRNAVQLLEMIGPKEPRLVQLRDIVDRQVTHMARLIDDLLDATRLARGQILLRKERVDLTKLVQLAAEDYRSIFDSSGLSLEVEVPDRAIWVEGDPTRLAQAVSNLLHNSHKFTDPGGTISVRLQLQENEEKVSVHVRDTGIGIDPKMLHYVFDVFRQAEQGLDRNRGGLGLGLALVKGLVQLHDGEVQVSSEGKGKGTEFVIRLPVETVMEAGAVLYAGQAIPEGEKCRVLVIEDNRDTAESVRLLLSLKGYEVQTAHTGNDGLERARTFEPQVVLCDIGLPGMDGYQVARTMRQDALLSSAYIIALTGYGRDEDQRQAHEAGFDLHMTKPIDFNSLRRALANLPARMQAK